MTWREEQNAKPEPEVFSPEELTRKSKEQKVMLWLQFAMIVVAAVFMLIIGARKSKAPGSAAPDSAVVAQLSTKLDSLSLVVAAKSDTLKKLQLRFDQVADQSDGAVRMIEQRAQDLDHMDKRVHTLEMNLPSK